MELKRWNWTCLIAARMVTTMVLVLSRCLDYLWGSMHFHSECNHLTRIYTCLTFLPVLHLRPPTLRDDQLLQTAGTLMNNFIQMFAYPFTSSTDILASVCIFCNSSHTFSAEIKHYFFAKYPNWSTFHFIVQVVTTIGWQMIGWLEWILGICARHPIQ